jgi:hypothetical protein
VPRLPYLCPTDCQFRGFFDLGFHNLLELPMELRKALSLNYSSIIKNIPLEHPGTKDA